jgi:hypothetical protein
MRGISMARDWHRPLAVLLLSASPLALQPALAQEAGGTWLDTVTVVGTRTETAVRDNPRNSCATCPASTSPMNRSPA